MSRYYIHGCKTAGSNTERCDDSEAQLWTLYERETSGMSQAITDSMDRRSAEIVMSVYAERDRLNEQVRALAAENAVMLRLLGDISENHVEYLSEGENGMFAGVPLDYVSEINMYVSRDVNAENPFPTTDAILNEVGGRAVAAVLPPEKVINASTDGARLCRYQGYNEALRDVRALNSQPVVNPPVVPDGWKLVPTAGLTQEMAEACKCVHAGLSVWKHNDIYLAALMAAPLPGDSDAN